MKLQPNPIIKIDGIPIRLNNPDLDGDGETGGVETLVKKNPRNEQDIVQPTETGEALNQLNLDDIGDNKLTTIDMRGRLHHAEVSFILALDALVSLKIVPSTMLSFTRRKKRLSVSVDGKGRNEIVNIVAGREEKEKAKFGERATTFVSGK